MAELTLQNVTKIYDDSDGSVTAVDDLSLSVRDGEFLVLVGPSGCGKSTTLRMIAGLESVTDGTIATGDREVQEFAPSARNVAMVFQSYALYKRMTARENMGYGLKHADDVSASERSRKVEETAELLGIEELLDDKPEAMSGGQKQRVALGRAIVRDPAVFLLDEPLSNLDAKLRSEMRTELQRIQDDLGVTTVYVTHDQTEAMTMADRIAVMNQGVLQQVDPPEVAYDHPTNEFVATFLGSPAMNVLPVTVRHRQNRYEFIHDGVTLAQIPAESTVLEDDSILEDGSVIRIGLRPEDIELADPESVDGVRFDVEVVLSEYQGNDNFITVSIADESLMVRAPPAVNPNVGEMRSTAIAPEDVYLFDPETGRSLKTRGLEARSIEKTITHAP